MLISFISRFLKALRCRLVDQKISRQDLPVGTTEVVASLGVEGRKKRRTEPLPLGNDVNEPPNAVPAAIPKAKAAAENPASSEPQPKKSCLAEQLSSAGDSEEEVEVCARGAKASFEAGNLVSLDRNCPTAEYWLRAFVRSVGKKTAAESQGDLHLFPRFVCSNLLSSDQAMQHLSTFVALLKELKGQRPDLVEKAPMASALIALRDYNPASESEVDLTNLSSLRQQRVSFPPFFAKQPPHFKQ